MSNETKQTAVDKLETQIEKLRFQGVTEWQCGYQKALNEVLFLLKQAKEMEKEQMIEIYHEYEDYLDYEFKNQQGGQGVILTFEQFYKETYGGNK
jgi:hypothetical protein